MHDKLESIERDMIPIIYTYYMDNDMTIFKEGFEYLVETNAPFPHRVVVNKIQYDKQKINFTLICYRDNDPSDLITIMNDQIINVIEPINSIEVFQMWIKYNSLVNKIPKIESEKLRDQITETFKMRSYVMFGNKKLEPYDYKNMYALRTDIDSHNFVIEVGETYLTQDDKHVRILGRTDTKGYECLICDDGIYRYDRSTNNDCVGRTTGSRHDYSDPRNLKKNVQTNYLKVSR